jgi:hypothetical protein
VDDFHGETDAEESADRDRITYAYQPCGFARHDDLSGLARLCRRNDCYAHQDSPNCRFCD